VRETGEESEASQQAPTEKGEPAAEGSSSEAGNSAQEVSEYRAAYATWREGDSQQCIDRFRSFLQTYPSSSYADDAAFWMADCYFKQGDFKTAILRFDDVVTRYPAGNKASEALYRQGEALLRLGPGYGKAAGKAFERVVHEYPESPRAAEAKRQLELLGPG
jgi:tol-pal system protein YbgF